MLLIKEKKKKIRKDQNVLLIKQKQKKFKKTKTYLNGNHGWETGTTKVHVWAYFQKFCNWQILTLNESSTFWHLRMNAMSPYWSYIDFYTLITYTSYITYIWNYTTCIDCFIIYWFLHCTKAKNFFHWNVSWNPKKTV